MEIEQSLRPRLWRWTATHPDWSPEEGGPDGWQPEVSSHALVEEDALVLIDPLVPADDEERFWQALDTDVEHHGPPQTGGRGTGTRAVGRRSSTAIRVRASRYQRRRRRRHASGSSSRTRSRPRTRCREESRRRRPITRQRCCSGFHPSARSQRATSCSARPRVASASAPNSVVRRGSLALGAPRSAARMLLLDLPIELVFLAHGEPGARERPRRPGSCSYRVTASPDSAER